VPITSSRGLVELLSPGTFLDADGVPVVFAAGGSWRTVVRRETWDDLLSRDVD
jgi:hypothetical protein